MIFNKTTSSSSVPLAEIAIIGTSALAFFLDDTLHNTGCRVTVLVPPHQLEAYNKRGAFCIKQSRFQNKNVHFNFACTPTKPCDFCFFASTPGQSQTDLTLLQHSFLATTPIINLSSLYNNSIISNFTTSPVFAAFSNCQLSLNKNTVEMLERSPKLEIVKASDNTDTLKQIFADTPVNLNFITATPKFLWTKLAVYFIGSLLLMIYGKNISSILMRQDIRQQTDSAITEIIGVAQKEKATPDSSEILAQLYTFADDYSGDIITLRDFNAFSNLIKNINNFETPTLFNLLIRASKKY